MDSAGSAYVVGGSTSPDFPVSSNAFQKTLRGDQDAVAVKLNPTGTALEYSTFLGSTATDWAIAIAVDRDGYAYLTGSTNGPDFPTTPGAHDTVYQGYLQIRESEPFVTKLNPTGTALTYSTFLNGTRSLYGRDIAVDAAGNAHIVSGDFVSKLDAAGAVLRFSQIVARGTPGDDVVALALDPAGNVYAGGKHHSETAASESERWCIGVRYISCFGSEALWQRHHSTVRSNRSPSSGPERLVLHF